MGRACNRSLSRGFTLIELLLVMTIMSLVVGSATYAFSLFSRNWDQRTGAFDRELGKLQRLELVNDAIEDAIPWVVRDRAGKVGFYFLGRDEGLTLVSGSPIFSPGRPAVIRVFREAESPGRWRLVYEEAPLRGVKLRDAEQTLPFKHRMVVARGVTTLAFRYFGWRDASDRIEAQDGFRPIDPEWFDEFDAIQRGIHPDLISVRMGGEEVVYSVPQRGTVTAGRLDDSV